MNMIDWSEINRWKLIKNEGVNVINLETLHSFELVFQHVKDRLEDITRNEYMVSLIDVEIPQADPSWTRTNYNPKDLLSSSILPRAVYMYDINSGLETIVDTPSMQRANRTLYSQKYTCCSVHQERITTPDGEYFNYMRDIDFRIVAVPRYSSFTGFWSILVNEKPQAIELMRQLKWKFPLNESSELYAGKMTEDGPYGGRVYPIPFTTESYIPSKIMEFVANSLQLEDLDEDKRNEIILNVLRTYSENRIEYKANSGTGYNGFVVVYPTPVIITPMSIDIIDNADNHIKTYGVKFEFRIDYVDFPMFRFSSSMKCINKDNPMLIKEPTLTKYGRNGLAPVYEAPFKENINNTTILYHYEVSYSIDDIKSEIDPDSYKLKRYAEINVYDLVEDVRLKQYIKYIIKNRCKLNTKMFFNVEAKKAFHQHNAEQIIGMEPNFKYDDVTTILKDVDGKVDDRIFIAIYINKEHFQKWLIKMGFTHMPNLSSVDAE